MRRMSEADTLQYTELQTHIINQHLNHQQIGRLIRELTEWLIEMLDEVDE